MKTIQLIFVITPLMLANFVGLVLWSPTKRKGKHESKIARSRRYLQKRLLSLVKQFLSDYFADQPKENEKIQEAFTAYITRKAA